MNRRCAATITLFGLFIALAYSPAAYAATNTELVPGARIVFPYYDLRPGYTTLLLLANTGSTPAPVTLEFYDTSCSRQDSGMGLSAGDIDLLDLHQVISGNASASFLQGFVDITTDADVLIGTAVVANMVADWSITYNGAPARRQAGSRTPFEPYPTRLFLPAFLTPGQLGNREFADGLLIVAAPHPTSPGAELPDEPIQASAQIFLRRDRTAMIKGRLRSHEITQWASDVSGHYIIAPIGTIAGTFTPPLFGWLSIRNYAVDESGIPFGLVGLYIQTLVGPNGASAMAIRLSGDPSVATTP